MASSSLLVAPSSSSTPALRPRPALLGERPDEREQESRRFDGVVEALVVRFKQLDQRPDGDVLERRVRGTEESDEVEVESPLGLGPDRVEGLIVVGGFRGEVADRRGRVALDFDRG